MEKNLFISLNEFLSHYTYFFMPTSIIRKFKVNLPLYQERQVLVLLILFVKYVHILSIYELLYKVVNYDNSVLHILNKST